MYRLSLDCFKWENEISSAFVVKLGVPQGNVLGSILFILYFNDSIATFRYNKIK